MDDHSSMRIVGRTIGAVVLWLAAASMSRTAIELSDSYYALRFSEATAKLAGALTRMVLIMSFLVTAYQLTRWWRIKGEET